MVDHLHPHRYRSYFVSNRNDWRSHSPNRLQTLIADPAATCGHNLVRGVLSALLRSANGIHRTTEFEERGCA